MGRAWTDHEVAQCVAGMQKITAADSASEPISNSDIKRTVAEKVGRSVPSVRSKMRQVAWVLNERGEGSRKRLGNEPGAMAREQIVRMLGGLKD
jgi:hypothetical protein